MLISVSVALNQTPAEAAIQWTRGQCVAWSACLAPSLRLYQFILLGKHVCEQLAQGRYVKPELKPAIYWLQVQRLNHCATTRHTLSFYNELQLTWKVAKLLSGPYITQQNTINTTLIFRPN